MTDRPLSQYVLGFLAVQLFVGLALVLRAQGPAPAPVTVVEQKISDDVNALEARVQRIESLHLEARLAVLDALSDRSWRIELLVVGLFLTTGAQLLVLAWDRRGRSPARRLRRVNDDE